MNRQRLLFAVASATRYQSVLTALAKSFDITLANNRWDADAALQEDPDVLVVADVLPGGRGLELCERGRNRPGGSRRLVLVVGDSDTAALERARSRGIIDGWIARDAGTGSFLNRLWDLQTARDDARVAALGDPARTLLERSEEHTSELQSLMRI